MSPNSSMKSIGKVGKHAASLADLPDLRIRPAAWVDGSKPLLAKALELQKTLSMSVFCLHLKRSTCAFRHQQGSKGWATPDKKTARTLSIGADLHIDNQWFVVRTEAFTFSDVNAFDLGR